MTAIVGVLSRRGVAFAADSAATHTSSTGHKITNHANKIFTLSKYQPVGVALYNNLDFMGVPWDSIIKSYRDSLKQKSFGTLREYVNGLWPYMKNNILPNLVTEQINRLNVTIDHFLKENLKTATTAVGGTVTPANEPVFFQKLEESLNQFKTDCSTAVAEDYKNYKLQDLEKTAKTTIDATLSSLISSPNCPKGLRQLFVEALHALICHPSHGYYSCYTGLVFFGYGSKELFPSCIEYRISIAMDKRIKYVFTQDVIIDNNNTATVIPFAQIDVTNTVIRAVEDDLRVKFYENYSKSIKGFRDEIVLQMQKSKAPQQFIDVLNALDLDKYSQSYRDAMNDHIASQYINPLINTVSFLSKEDLADMAESLVRMTCIKRRITTQEETVGGPVDVAVITKGDGFIWMKRKHYFDPALNQQFFERYNK